MSRATPTYLSGRPWGRAACWLSGLGPFFFLSYGAANWLATMHSHVGSWVFEWERNIPFMPWTIIPYWSIDALYGISLFICATKREVDTHAFRLLTAQVIAVTCFILFPLTFTFARPEVGGISGLLFRVTGKFDKPFNQAPSLHIALLVILWDRFARHVPNWARWILHGWFVLIGLSVLTTYQHHFIDIPTGALFESPVFGRGRMMAPTRSRRAGSRTTPRGCGSPGSMLWEGSLFCALAASIGGNGLWLFWPAVSLFLVAANYAFRDAAGFQKSPSGKMALASRWLLAPYIFGAWINLRLWTRANRFRFWSRTAYRLGDFRRAPSRPDIRPSSIFAPSCRPGAAARTGARFRYWIWLRPVRRNYGLSRRKLRGPVPRDRCSFVVRSGMGGARQLVAHLAVEHGPSSGCRCGDTAYSEWRHAWSCEIAPATPSPWRG